MSGERLRKADPEKTCRTCGELMRRRRYGRRLEDRSQFLRRQFCSPSCKSSKTDVAKGTHEASFAPGDRAFMDYAVCVEVHPETFYPPQGIRATVAREVCARCPVTAECLEYALTYDIDLSRGGKLGWGVWGGLIPAERFSVRRLQVSA